MILYFTNDSKQKKKLLETDYVEDIFDEITAFFEEHHFRPHFLQVQKYEGEPRIVFGSMTEYFGVMDVSEADAKELMEYNND